MCMYSMYLIVDIYRFLMIKISLDDITEILPIHATHNFRSKENFDNFSFDKID